MTAATLPAPTATGPSIRHLPVNLFAAVMTLAGTALAWRLAEPLLGLPSAPAEAIGALAVAVFVVLAAGYGAKALRHPDAVAAEFAHPIAGNFFGTIGISLLLLGAVVRPWSAAAGETVWALGALATFAMAFSGVSRLLAGSRAPELAVPAWLIAGVAALDVPVTGGAMGLPWAAEANLAGAGIGAALAVPMLAAIFARLVFQAPLPDAMRPSQMILVAPFALGFLAYANLAGGVDRFAGLLFYAALFFFAIASTRVFRRPAAFGPGWWAIGFPVAALTNAALRYAGAHPAWPLTALAGALLAGLVLASAVLAVRTVAIAVDGRLLAG